MLESVKTIDFYKKHSYPLALLLIWLFSLLIRFWKIDQFNQLVFDEVYLFNKVLYKKMRPYRNFEKLIIENYHRKNRKFI